MNILSKITEKTKMTSEMPKLKAGRLYRKEKSIIHQSITLNNSVALIGRSDFPISTCTIFTKLLRMSTVVKIGRILAIENLNLYLCFTPNF